MKQMITAIAAISALLITGCAQNSNGGYFGNVKKQEVGAVSGAVLGGVLGSNIGGGKGQLIAVGAGSLLGAFIGSEIGSSLDRADKVFASQAMNRAYEAPIGETISWTNPESGNSGTYTPVNEGYGQSSGRYCREYKQTIVVDGRSEQAVGTACENVDGTWEIMS